MPRLQNATPPPRQLPCASGRFSSALRLLVTDVFLSHRKLLEPKLASLRRCTRDERMGGQGRGNYTHLVVRIQAWFVVVAVPARQPTHVLEAAGSAARKLCAVLAL